MNFDLKLPIGILFTIIGAILGIYGLITSGNEMYQRSLEMNVNLIWGGVLFAFGVLMLGLAFKKEK